MKLLLVEDDADLARWVMNLMQVEQFAIDWAQNGERAETLLGLQCYDAVLLDLRLPGMSGKDVLARLRRKRDKVPVLMLTANGSTDDKVACFSAGADDYVVKPFDARELVARINALIRRQAAGDNGQSIECGNLRYLFDSREFVIGHIVKVTLQEFTNMKSFCFAAAFVVLTAGCASTWPPAKDQTARPGPADTDTYILHSEGATPRDSTSKPPRLSVGTSYSDTQLILPWFLNDIINFVNYR